MLTADRLKTGERVEASTRPVRRQEFAVAAFEVETLAEWIARAAEQIRGLITATSAAKCLAGHAIG